MRKARRLILLVAIFASLGGVAYKVADTVWINKILDIKKDPLKALDSLPEAALSIRDFHRAKIENGRKVWELFGDEADYLKEQKEAVIKKPRFYYYDKKGERAETSGDVAHLFFSENQLEKMHLKGGVHVAFQGYVLKSDEAIYLPAKEQIVMPSRTTVVGDGLEVEGSRMEVELEDQKVRLLQNVKTKIEPQKIARQKRGSDKLDLTEAR
jgi:LPS export ABC transporter protein LptC